MRLLAAFLIVSAAPAAAQSVLQPAPAQNASWTHAKSGISLPLAIGDMRRGAERDLSNGAGNDVTIQYGSDTEPVTVYVYRSAYPNPALWFERTRHAIGVNVGMTTQDVAPRSFTIGQSAAPNGLREEIALPPGGQWKSTAVAIAQAGEWMIKARITSQTLDGLAVSRKMDSLLGAVRLARVPPKPLPLIVPPPCERAADLDGKRLSGDLQQEIISAGMTGFGVLHASRGAVGLAADPASWCRESTQIPAQYASVYRANAGKEWVALVGDSGMAVSARMVEQGRGATPAAATFGSNATRTALVAVFDNIPHPDAAVIEALPVAAGQQPGLVSVSAEAKAASPSSPKPR